MSRKLSRLLLYFDVLYPRSSNPYVPVQRDGQEAEHGAHKRHAQQGVDHVVHLPLRGALLVEVSSIHKHQHHVLYRLGEAGDGVEGRQAADEAVHGRVEVTVVHDGHHHQQVLHQTHHPHGEEEGHGQTDLLAVGLIGRQGRRGYRGVIHTETSRRGSSPIE